MSQPDRRIRRLRLAGSDPSLLTAARFRLEEAFRLASLPGLPLHALVLIRRFELGRFRADLPPWQLADRIENRVRELAARAVCIDRRTAADSPVVWFSDPVQPYVALITRLLDTGQAREWYWNALFPGEQPAADSTFIEKLLQAAAASPLQALAQGLLLQHCLVPVRRDRLFSLLTRPMATRLLQALGQPLPATGGPDQQTAGPATGPGTPAPAKTLFRQGPIRPPQASQPWRAALQWAVRHWGEGDERTLWLTWHALLCHQPAYLDRRDILPRIAPADWLAQWAGVGSPDVTGKNSGATSAGPPLKRLSPAGEEALALVDAAVGLSAETKKRPASGAPERIAAAPDGRAAKQAAKAEDLARPADPAPDQLSRSGPGPKTGPDARLRSIAQTVANVSPDEQGVGAFSRHAGFALLIPVLARLGLAELLARHELLAALDFPSRLLAAVAPRIGLAEDDPCRVLFAKPVITDNPVVERFRAPAAWWQLAAARGRGLHRFQTSTGEQCVITGFGGRLLLAVNETGHVKDGEEPVGQKVEDGGVLPQPVRINDLIRTMQLAAGVYLRRCCAMSLRTLLARPGRVVLTPTHWDVIFDLNQTDLRLRRMALDSDPGWVVWLGKVVQFHYW